MSDGRHVSATEHDDPSCIRELAWQGLCGLLELSVIMTLVIIVGTLLV